MRCRKGERRNSFAFLQYSHSWCVFFDKCTQPAAWARPRLNATLQVLVAIAGDLDRDIVSSRQMLLATRLAKS